MSSPIARTYARALVEAAGDDARRVVDEFGELAHMRDEVPELAEALHSPSTPAAVRHRVIDAVLADAHPVTRNFLKVLVNNGRMDDATEIIEHFHELVREREQQLDVHVTSAVELEDALRTKLEQRLSADTGKQVHLHTSVDPDIIGGLVVRYGDTLVDTSLRGRLESMRIALSRPVPRAAATTTSSDD